MSHWSEPLSYLPDQAEGPWSMFLAQINQAVPYLGPLAYWAETLRRPRRVFVVDVPIHMDDGTIAHFDGYRIHHNTARGPAKGGVRYHPEVNLSEVMALAGWMSIKNAAVGLPYGGGKGGIRVDPARLSPAELERLTRRYTAEISMLIGPNRDVLAPDMGTGPQEMAWMMDTYSMGVGVTSPGVVTGKPNALGGSLGRQEATGRGVFAAAQLAAAQIGLEIKGARVVIQGFGNVGSVAAREFTKALARVVAIADVSGAIYCESGIEPLDLMAWVREYGGVRGYPKAQALDPDQIFTVPSDIAVPAALEAQIHSGNAWQIPAKLIVEGANGPTTPEADEILAERGVLVVPDVIANAGGVTGSYLEWVQDFNSYFWEEEEVHAKISAVLLRALRNCFAVAEERKVTLRQAAFIIGCTRILEAMELRGLYP